ncbi:glycosyltransferase family 2 protein [Utexia brackfieldae]|uniref:glycosyltransferase family 2 protein n=1 Tax=Utexia brackfieldae TaxID=3074108 RepID=UPI00370D9CCB
MSVSLVITTYNWPQALELVLMSVMQQSVLPNEVIIADDGSTVLTRDLIAKFQENFPVPLHHSWQDDDGFRAARSRNKAMAKATGNYIVIIDGDMILHHHFIRDHKKAAKPNQFIQGRRVILTEKLTKQTFDSKNIHFSVFSPDVKNKFNTISCRLLSPLVSCLFSKQSYRSIRSCNMAMWKQDVIKVNGFNEAFVGWGREDSEFALRMLNAGIKRKDLRLGGVAYHLYHREQTRNNLNNNDRLLEEAVKNQVTTCQHGLSEHL